MVVPVMPKPAAWRHAHRALWWPILPALALCAWPAYDGLAAANRGDYLSAVAILGFFAGPLALIGAASLALFGKVTARVSWDATGTTLWPDRRIGVVSLAGLAMMVPAGILLMILVPRGQIAIAMSRGMQIFSPAVFGLAVGIAAAGLISVWRREGIGYLKLLPTGLEIASIVATKLIPWEDVVRVSDVAATSKAPNPIVLCRRDGTEETVTGASGYVPYGAGLYWMVQHYWRHPEDRPELGDSRAIGRLGAGHFDGMSP